MSRYLVRVQVLTCYDIVINAASSEHAIATAEALRPSWIRARGRQSNEETGLADPESPRLVVIKSEW